MYKIYDIIKVERGKINMNLFSIIWIFGFCFGGIIFIALAIYLKSKTDSLITKCTSMCNGISNQIGEIIRETHNNLDNGPLYLKEKFYFPIYEFEVQGKKYKTRGTLEYDAQEKIKLGEIVKINYNPENPEECYKEGDPLPKAWLIFLIVGFTIIIVGLLTGFLISKIFKN